MCEHVIYAGGRSSFSLWQACPGSSTSQTKEHTRYVDHAVFSRLGLMFGVSPLKLTAVKDQEYRLNMDLDLQSLFDR